MQGVSLQFHRFCIYEISLMNLFKNCACLNSRLLRLHAAC